jgi:hypothetical protein
MGFRIPEDFAYINLLGPSQELQVAGVDCGGTEVMIKCAERLDFLVRHRRMGLPKRPWEMIMSPHWVPGASLPPAPAPTVSGRKARVSRGKRA